jgi:hypothetical protein
MTTNLPLVQKTAQARIAGLVLIVLAFFLLAGPTQSAVAAPMFTSDGDGTLTVSPSSVAYDSTTTFDFTFTADTGDFIDGSQLVISIPDGWTPPSNSGAGRVTILSNTCTLRSPGAEVAGFNNTSPMSVSVDFGCAQGESFTLRYASAKATGVALYTFTSTTEIPGGVAPAEIAVSPTIDVMAKMLTVGATALSADNKVYDGTTDATFTNGDLSLVGITPGDIVTLDTSGGVATFADKNAGNGKTVTFSGLTLAGADSGNYELTQPTRTANITKLPMATTPPLVFLLFPWEPRSPLEMWSRPGRRHSITRTRAQASRSSPLVWWMMAIAASTTLIPTLPIPLALLPNCRSLSRL